MNRARIFAFLLNIVLADLAEAQKSSPIEIPEPPVADIPPPFDYKKENTRILEKKQEERGKREEKFKPPEKEPTIERNKKLLNEMIAPRPDRAVLTTSIVYPLSFVSGPRSEYVFEPSTVFNAYWRLSDDKNDGRMFIWTGFRLASFAGTGIYKNVAGRFGFSYFGPMIGVGKIEPAPASLPSDAEKPGTNPGSFLAPRYGAFFAMGVSGTSQSAELSGNRDEPGGDLEEKPFGYEAPGAWMEGLFTTIHFGAVVVNALVGVHVAEGKNLVYFGAGIGGTY